MNFIKIATISFLLVCQVFALTKDEIKPVMTKKINKALDILSQTNLSTKEKGDKLIKELDDVFNYPLMARITLGSKTWKSINKNQRNAFIKAFEKKLKNDYISKLTLYKNQKLKIGELKPYKKNKLKLESLIIGKNDNYPVIYNFYGGKNNNWLIYDVNLAGVSVITTNRLQITGLLKQMSFDKLLDTLKNNQK